jgi:hypothetical protein
VTRQLLASLLFAVAAVAAASVSGGLYRPGALAGAVTSSVTALASLLLMQRGARARRPLQAALAVMATMFMGRVLLVAVAAWLLARAGANVIAFAIAFFVPYLVFTAIEGWYLSSASRSTGNPA